MLVGSVDDGPLNFASNVVVDDADGTMYFSASTRRFDLEHYLGDLLEHSGTGRLFRRDPDGAVTTLLDGLDFANGVVLAPDRSCVLVAQTGRYCVTRYWLTGPAAGTSDTLIDNLPGFPDNMSLGSDGLVWISLPTARNPLLDKLLPLPGVLRQLVWLVPDQATAEAAEDGVGAGRLVRRRDRARPAGHRCRLLDGDQRVGARRHAVPRQPARTCSRGARPSGGLSPLRAALLT